MREIIPRRTPPPKRSGPAGGRASIGDIHKHKPGSHSAGKIQAQQRGENFPDALADARLARQVAQLWQLGPRPIFELLVELGAERLIRTPIETKVTKYVDRLLPGALAAAGGDRMPPPVPLHRVP
jgi:hypothetical protein